jgi:transglutaminase-like putative cysteine protease
VHEHFPRAPHPQRATPVLIVVVALVLVLTALLASGCTPASSAVVGAPAGQPATLATQGENVSDVDLLVSFTYPHTREEMLELLATTYPDTSEAAREAWLLLDTTETREIDGEVRYFLNVPENLAFRDVELFRTKPESVSRYRDIYELIVPYIEAARSSDPLRPFAEPTTYTFTQSLAIPREELPAGGELELWLPLPLEGGAQTGVVVHEMEPLTYLSLPPSITHDIGLLYMNVPLETLHTDLEASITFSYSRAPEYFTIDPQLVGTYDPQSALYQMYTSSRANTAVTPSIRAKAKEIVGGETNPYLAAERIYRYVVNEVQYSLMPHLLAYPRGIPESVYVHENRYGDCGAQSMYFSALCRSVGIPARTTGGFQIFSGKPSGHFWAEFYLPHYGWIPVDTSAAQIAGYVPEVSEQERLAFEDFFFGNLDPFRLVVQRDTDLELIPRAGGTVLLPMAIQMPAALCDNMGVMPGLVASEHYTIE